MVQPIQKRSYCGYRITCVTGGKFLNLFTDTAKKHGLTILKEKEDDFAERLKGETVIADKGYVSREFAEEMEKRGVVFVAVKGEDMMKGGGGAEHYGSLSSEKGDRNTVLSCG